jgi:TatD DNase family protein
VERQHVCAGLLADEGRAGLEELVRHPRVVAVGETGLDFYHDNWPHSVQEDVFVRHIDLAHRAGLPVVVHTREAAELTLDLLADHAEGLTDQAGLVGLEELADARQTALPVQVAVGGDVPEHADT